MKNSTILTFAIILFTNIAFSQNLTQTLRGNIIDADSQMPLIAAEILILGSDPLVGTTSDVDGNFRFENIPVGRVTLQLSYLGYENKIIPNIVVNSGKEVVLNLSMEESIIKMEEVVVKAVLNGEALNDMSLISARSISVEETSRYAGSFNDPSRIMSSFAGVTNTQDGSNDIIVRGNSPKYIQWRLEGVEITNPNHFADQNAVSGGVSALNNNMLATSDFYTAAFTSEYGNVLSGVYDVKLRAGNNEKFESTFGFGLIGADLTIEGPFKKGYKGSYLLNYRYSLASIIDAVGLIDLDGILKFQDASFKIVLPTKNIGNFSLFGLAGLSSFLLNDIKPDMWQTPGDNNLRPDISEDFDKSTYLLNTGINHSFFLNDHSFIKTTLSYSTDGIDDDIFESKLIKVYNDAGELLRDSIVNRNINFKSRYKKSSYRAIIKYSNKINAKNKIQIGIAYSLFDYNNNQSKLQEESGVRFSLVDTKDKLSTINNFINWKHRLNENITIVSGLHNTNILFNNKTTLEPRLAIKWKLNNTNSFSIGYGHHTKMESLHNYFAKVKNPDGTISEPNKDLDLLKAHHFILAYEKRFTKNLMLKVEAYYQGLYNLPVENNDTSYYATLNEGLEYKYLDLVNEGTGKNYGIEFTLERFFNNNYYFLINASLYNSTYKSLEGIERNTRYNGNYLFNLLCGKEFEHLGKKQNRTLSINAKIFFGGGAKYIPLLRDGQGNLAVDPANNKFWDYKKAYENKLDDAYNITISLSYKFNKPKATHELFLNLENVTNHKGRVSEYYDESEPNNVGYLAPLGFFPNFMYRVYF